MCGLRARQDLDASDARPQPLAEQAYLRGLPEDEAARVMGSRARRDAVLAGASVESVVNAGVDPLYRLARVGDGVAQLRAVGNDSFKLPEPGEPHHGLMLNIRERLGPDQLRAGIATFGKRIEEHEGWIANPLSKAGVELHEREDIDRWVRHKWPQDIERLKAQRAIYEAVLKEKERASKSGGT